MCVGVLVGIGVLCAAASLAAAPPSDDEKGGADLYFGEAVFYARQGHWFDALERLDAELGQHRAIDEPELDSLYLHLREAEFSVGDFELEYRMHLRAGHAITAVLEGAVDEQIRNDAAYRLARIHFQNGQLDDALQALDRIQGKVPDAIRGDVEFLRANVYLGLGRNEDAVAVRKRRQGGGVGGGGGGRPDRGRPPARAARGKGPRPADRPPLPAKRQPWRAPAFS